MTSPEALMETPLYPIHLKLGARIVPFAGYKMPVQYSGVLQETRAVRSHCGLFDVSHMGQFTVRGDNPLKALQKLVTNNLSRIAIGQAQYNMMCNASGGVIDDLIIYNRSKDRAFICVNASNRKVDFEWMKEHLPPDLDLIDESSETALIALQGPNAEKILTPLTEPNTPEGLKYYWAVETTVLGYSCYLSRTGYTGEDGFEIYINASNSIALWEGLTEAGSEFGLTPCGLGARDTLRLEMGYPLHGHELSSSISPLSAGLGWVVKLNQDLKFIGEESLINETKTNSKRVLKGLQVNDRRIARQGYQVVLSDNTIIGDVTSGTHSPHLDSPIALAYIDRPYAEQSDFLIMIRESLVPATRVKLPFVQSHTKK